MAYKVEEVREGWITKTLLDGDDEREPRYTVQVTGSIMRQYSGELPLAELSRLDKVVALVGVQKIMALLDDLGWHEHTGDWDAYVEVVLGNGLAVWGSDADGIKPVGVKIKELEQENFTACVNGGEVEKVWVQGISDEGEDVEIAVAVDDVVSINWSYEG